METKTLVLNFITDEGKRASISIDEPKFDLMESEVKEAMESIITDDVFRGTMNAKLVAIHSAQIVKRTVESLYEEI